MAQRALVVPTSDQMRVAPPSEHHRNDSPKFKMAAPVPDLRTRNGHSALNSKFIHKL